METINETIASAIVAEIESSNGTYTIEVEIDANTVAEVTGSYEIDGYTDIRRMTISTVQGRLW